MLPNMQYALKGFFPKVDSDLDQSDPPLDEPGSK
jgi:hypothetical protein